MNIIITVASLDGFHGSVLHVKEWVEGLTDYFKNPKIKVVCIFVGQETKKLIENAGAEVYDIREFLSLEEKSENDLIIAYHFPILEKMLLSGVRSKKIISWSLSPYEPLEAFPPFWRNLSLLIANSVETKLKRAETQEIPVEKITVINNPIPKKFQSKVYSTDNSNQSDPNILNVLIVSNHVPIELSNLIKWSRTNITFSDRDQTVSADKNNYRRISFVHCGQGGDIIKEVTPQLIEQFDVVVTIGKTVQYCLGMAVPVFEYDRFGGRGYINLSNYDEAKKFNFSGRPGNRILSSHDLFMELREGFSEARRQTRELKEKAFNDFSIDNQIEYLFRLLSEKEEINTDFPNEIIKFKNFDTNVSAFILYFGWLKGESHRLTGELNSLNSNVQQLKEQLNRIESSKAYKLALMLRKFKSFLLNQT